MPFLTRQNIQSQQQAPQIANVQFPGGATPQLKQSPETLSNDGLFWASLASGLMNAGAEYVKSSEADAYIRGQEDSTAGREMQAQSFIDTLAYKEGYNKITRANQVATMKLEGQQMAYDYAMQGKDTATFLQDYEKKQQELLQKAEQDGLNLRREDHQAFVQEIAQAKFSAQKTFSDTSRGHIVNLNMQAINRELNAGINDVRMSAPARKAELLDNMLIRINSDVMLTDPAREGVTASLFSGLLSNMDSKEDVQWAIDHVTKLEEFTSLPMEQQSSILRVAQTSYEQQAQRESGIAYSTAFAFNNAQTLQEFDTQFPQSQVFAMMDNATNSKVISQATSYSLKQQYMAKREELIKAQKTNLQFTSGTILDVASYSGRAVEPTTSAAVEWYASRPREDGRPLGYARGGLAMFIDGMMFQDGIRKQTGIMMLNKVLDNLTSMDVSELKYDKDGNPIVREDIADAMYSVQQMWERLPPNNRSLILKDLPNAVRYGLMQGVDNRSLLTVILSRQAQINRHQVNEHPATLPDKNKFTSDELLKGWTDWGFSDTSTVRRAMGVNAPLWASGDETKAARMLAAPYNAILGSKYAQAVMSGDVLSDADDTAAEIKLQMAGDTVRVDNGTEDGMFVMLSNMPMNKRKEGLGTTANDILAEALAPKMKELAAQYPSAVATVLDYDETTDAFNIMMYDARGQQFIADSIRQDDIKREVTTFQQQLNNTFAPKAWQSPAYVPGAGGMVTLDTRNTWGIPSNQAYDMMSWIIHFEGYTPEKGFSILESQNPKYSKAWNDTPQMAANKFSAFMEDFVYPKVHEQMKGYKRLPQILQNNLRVVLGESTYHAGNSQAFGKYVDRIIRGEGYNNVARDFLSSNEAFIRQGMKQNGEPAERNLFRLQILQDIDTFMKGQ